MKGVITLLMMFVLWYFAGMFRQTYIMIVALCIGLMLIVLSVFAVYQRRKLDFTLTKKRSIAFKKLECTVGILAANRSRLPVNRYRVKVGFRYRTDKRGMNRVLSGCAQGGGDSVSEFYMSAPYCGVIDVSIRRISVYDPLTVFSSTKRIRNTGGEILVFPVEKRMNIIMPSTGSYDNIPLTDTRSPKPGDDHSEVHLIREYRPGDLTKHIHHNYSAKTDEIWVKEFSKENDLIFDLYLDTSDSAMVNTDEWDAFYEVVFSVLSNLVKRNISVNARYFDREKNGVVEFSVNNEGLCAELLAQLYLADKICTKEELYGGTNPSGAGVMIISTGLDWSFSGRPIYRFSKDKAEVELSALTFRL